MMIETYAYSRAGLLGNPSDGYFGRTIAFLVRDFRARVLLYPSARLEIKPSKADMPVFESLDDLYATTRWRGYYGGIRILQALVVRFMEYCQAHGIELPNRNFTLEYESTIPLRLGMGGSSSIIIAALRALCQYYGVDIAPPIQAKLALETETRELGVAAGPQDRVIQVYEGVVYMDFQRDLMESRGYGIYEALDPALLPKLYVAYRTSLSEGTEVFHNNIRDRWNRGDEQVVKAMQRWGEIALEGKTAIQKQDFGHLHQLINDNFDLRTSIYKIDRGNLEMIEAARSVGACSHFSGSGGAISGLYKDDTMFKDLVEVMKPLGVKVIKPTILPPASKSQ
jgi:glucuronokinase